MLFTNKTPLGEDIFQKLPGLKYVGVLATGYNVVDIEAAKKRGIIVTNIPAYGTDSVAQMTFALILELCQHVQRHSECMGNKRSQRKVNEDSGRKSKGIFRREDHKQGKFVGVILISKNSVMHQAKTKFKLKNIFRVRLFQLNCHGFLFRLYIGIIFLMAITATYSKAQDDRSHHISPQLIHNPSTNVNYTSESRQFSGIPSLAITEKGRMFAVWYAGITPGEDLNNYVVLAKSDNMGQTWEEILVIDPDGPGPVRSFDPEVWIDPDGKLWIFWAQAAKTSLTTWALITEGTSAGVWALTIKDTDRDKIKWPEPKRLTDGVMMCKPTVLSDGEWALPVSIWRMTEGSAQIVISNNRGKTWQVRGAADVPGDVRRYDEHMIVERKDGSLWMLVRTMYGIGESISYNRGRTWSPLVPSDIQHPSARFFIRRLNSGNLLLVKHGPITMQTERSHLMAFISKDDGFSWSQGLLLDERLGVSYPDGQQTKDGNIYIIYDFNRRSDQYILMTSFTEDDVVPCSDIKMVEVFQRRRVVSKGGKTFL